MDGEILKDLPTKKYKPITEMKVEELLSIIDGNMNTKIQAGLQMIISKIVVLIEDQVKFHVTEEIVEQMSLLKDK